MKKERQQSVNLNEKKSNNESKKPSLKSIRAKAKKPTQKKPKKQEKTVEKVKKQKEIKVAISKPTKVVEQPIKKSKSDKANLKIRFLGGVGEIGKNMTVIEYGKDIIVIDCGIIFPGDNMPGVDLALPDDTYLVENKDRIKAFIITHGHEDHIGALPFVLKDVNAPVYGTKLTLTLIENKLKERNVNAKLNCVTAGSTIKIGCFSIEFINVNHSIAGAVALSITTPVGVVFHSGDFKMDFTPVAGETINLSRISEIGKKGVLLLLADSTNVEIEGSTMSESVIKETFDHVFSANQDKRIIIATFASNVHRLQQILDLAVVYKRKVAFSGRSMLNIADSASKIGELTIPDGLIVDAEKVKNFKHSEIVVVSTGTQGEPMSALTRMASGEFNSVRIGENDTVVVSASVIPGNEKMIYGVINNLYKLGADVIYESLEPIHVSGHACKNELRVLHSLLKPKFFIPVHGEYRHLKKHENLAKSLGMKDGTTIIPEIGDTIEFTARQMKRGEKIPAGYKFVDGVSVDGGESSILKDRILMSESGIIVVGCVIDTLGYLPPTVDITAKGLTLTDSQIKEMKANLTNAINQADIKRLSKEDIALIVKKNLRNFIFKQTKKNPVIIPVVFC